MVESFVHNKQVWGTMFLNIVIKKLCVAPGAVFSSVAYRTMEQMLPQSQGLRFDKTFAKIINEIFHYVRFYLAPRTRVVAL